MITVGMSAEKVLSVKEEDTAKAWGSGTLPVLATPKMILLVEETAMEAVATELPEGDTTVGTLVDVKHVSASPVGSEVRCCPPPGSGGRRSDAGWRSSRWTGRG